MASVSERTRPRTRLQLARFFANPTHTANGVFIQRYFSLNLLNKGLGLQNTDWLFRSNYI